MSDLISREEVLRAVITAGEAEPDLGYTHLCSVIEALQDIRMGMRGRMTKIQMINMAIDLSYIQGSIHRIQEVSMSDCEGVLSDAIDTLVEEIVQQPGCSDCVYFGSECDVESPCNTCSRRHKDNHKIEAEGGE